MGGTFNSFEVLVVTNAAAVGFTPSTYGTARQAIVQVQAEAIRYRFDGGDDPTTTVGLEAAAGTIIKLTSKDQLIKFRAIAVATDAKCVAEFGY